LGAQLVSLCLRIDKLETQVGKALDERLNKENHQVRGSRFESMPDCMQPNIDSGATPIGSVGRAPDKQKKKFNRRSPVKEVQSKKPSQRSSVEEV
jgi:hypothetical protein